MRRTMEDSPSLIGGSPERADAVVNGAKRRRISADFDADPSLYGAKEDNVTRVSLDTETDLDTPPEVDLSDSLSSSPLPQPPETKSLEMVVDENTETLNSLRSSNSRSSNTRPSSTSSRQSRSSRASQKRSNSTPPPKISRQDYTPSPFLDKISPSFDRSYRLSALKSSIEGMKRRREANTSPSRARRRVPWTSDHWKHLEHLITPLQLYNAPDLNQLPSIPKFVADALPEFPVKEIQGRALAIARRQRKRIDTQIAALQSHDDGSE